MLNFPILLLLMISTLHLVDAELLVEWLALRPSVLQGSNTASSISAHSSTEATLNSKSRFP